MANAIEFKLWAPYNEKASLLGEFLEDSSAEMEKGKDGYFRKTVELEDGCYEYKFRVQSKSHFKEADEWVEVIDPYATEVNEEKQVAIARIKDGDRIIDDYVWQHDDAEIPEKDELVIYEMLVQDFAEEEKGGSFQTVLDKLDYLQDLGINTLELMPIQSCPMEIGWGYNLRHYFALRSSYGKPADLKKLIDECHARHMVVLLDVVLNHSESEAPLTKIDFDYWYHRDPKDPEQSWGPEFNYDHYDDNYDRYPARDYMRDMITFWLKEYHFDGLRFDAVKQLDRPEVLRWIVEEAGKASRNGRLYTIAEHIPEKPELGGLEGPVDGSWRVSFHYNFLDVVKQEGSAVDIVKQMVDPTQAGFQSTTEIVNYLTSHDQNRVMPNLAKMDIFDEDAFRRAKLGAVLVMTAMGVPMIWMGEEFGEYKPKTLDPDPLDWSLLDNEANAGLFKYYKGLISLRKENAALCSDNVAIFHENEDAQIVGYMRWHEMGAQVAIVVNCSDNYVADYEIDNMPENGTWHEWTRNYDITVEDGRFKIELGEYEAQVLVWSPE